jgi:glycerophosphoryl diester phosphodiesterase
MRRVLRTTDGGMSVIAHRGGSGGWRENTLEAFAGARAMGADGVELDARLSGDGQVVVHHDARLENGERIGELSRWQLPQWLPDLASVLSECEGMLVNVEIKLDEAEPGQRPDAARCRALATGLGELLVRRPEGVIVSSFWPDALVSFGEVAAGIATGLLVHPALSAEDAVTTASNLGCSALNPFYSAANASLVDQCHQAGLEVATWTVNHADDVRSLERSGVDAVITDEVRMALEAVGRDSRKPPES